jgi:hypothetical protein
MNRRPLFQLVALAAIAACAQKPPPEPPKAPAVVEPPPPPPPPPKCEALDEGCVAKAGLRVPLHPADWTLGTPEGWKYAVEADGVLADSADATLAVTTFEAPADKKPAAAKAKNAKRDETVAVLLEKLKITQEKKLSFPSKAQKSSKVHGVDIALYQFSGAKRSGEPGPLLVFIAQLTPQRVLVGTAFVAERDTTNADAAILKVISSFEPPPAADGGAPPAK